MSAVKLAAASLLHTSLCCGLCCTAMAADEEAPTALETVIVQAQRLQQPLQRAPLSVTAVTATELQDRGVRSVRDAAQYAPNVNMVDYSARAISNAQIRGIGGSPTNPGITTVIDGVPQLNSDTSSIELLDIEQIEFVRGSQGTLYGRNTLGGVINLRSWRPGFTGFAAGEQEFGDYHDRQTRLLLSGPLFRQDEQHGLAGSLAAGAVSRDGYSTNDFDGRNVDGRDARFGKGQLYFRPDERWDARLIAFGESAHDGDFALQDLEELRARPHRIDHDYLGYTQRRIGGVTAQLGLHLSALEIGAVFGGQRYRAFESTDLDASERDALQRDNRRKGEQYTQELNFASPQDNPLQLGDHLKLRWQGGLFHFTQSSDQDVVNYIEVPYLLQISPQYLGIPVALPGQLALPLLLLQDRLQPAQDRGNAKLDDEGFGVYAQGTLELGDWALTLGLRHDRERKQADLMTGTALVLAEGLEQPLGAPASLSASRSDAATTPRAVLQYRASENALLYASAARGYRAGGYNAASPEGSETYGEEFSDAYEAGFKSLWWRSRLSLNLALFHMDIRDLQLNQPLDGAGRFYIANAGSARNQGAELELALRLLPDWQFNIAVGTLDAQFGAHSSSTGRDISGHEIPLADPLTLNVGSEYRLRFRNGMAATLRGEYQRLGNYYYTADNDQRQPSYELVNLRAGLDQRHWRVELFLRNALDQDYIPLAIPFTGISPSGFVGESAPPRTGGVALSLRF